MSDVPLNKKKKEKERVVKKEEKTDVLPKKKLKDNIKERK